MTTPLIGDFGTSFSKLLDISDPAAQPVIIPTGATPIPNWRRMFRPGVYCGFVLVAILYALPWLSAPLGLIGSHFDPGERLRSWPESATVIDSHWQEFQAGSEVFLLVAGGRDVTSSLAFYLPDQPLVYRWTGSTRVGSQYELWQGPETRIGQAALIVVPGEDQPLPAALARSFTATAKVATVTAESAGGLHRRQYTLHRGENLLGWPSSGTKVPR